MVKTLKVIGLSAILALGTANFVNAEEAAAPATPAKPAKALSCKAQAKKQGIKNKKERIAFIKKCKADAKANKAK